MSRESRNDIVESLLADKLDPIPSFGKTSKLARARSLPMANRFPFLFVSCAPPQSFSFPSFLHLTYTPPSGTINSSFECVFERSKLHPVDECADAKTPVAVFVPKAIRKAFAAGRTREHLTPEPVNVSTRTRGRGCSLNGQCEL